jgi:hypothetical protein
VDVGSNRAPSGTYRSRFNGCKCGLPLKARLIRPGTCAWIALSFPWMKFASIHGFNLKYHSPTTFIQKGAAPGIQGRGPSGIESLAVPRVQCLSWVKTGNPHREQMSSAVHPTTDMQRPRRHVRVVPTCDIGGPKRPKRKAARRRPLWIGLSTIAARPARRMRRQCR